MPRSPKDHNTRRNEILDAVQRLIYSKGYEQMTIQDILDALNISKGAFYHYFDSKGAVLEAFIERMTDEALPLLIPIVQDPNLDAAAKLDRFFSTAGRWKMERKALMFELLRVWQADENAIVRQKLLAMSTHRIAPLLAQIIQQGVREGSMSPAFPEHVSDAVWTLLQGLSENLAGALVSGEPDDRILQQMQAAAAVFTDAIERVLGTDSGTLHLFDPGMLQAWLLPADNGQP